MTDTRGYLASLDRVTAYIHGHLRDDLDLDILARVAGFSPFHWHRVYRSVRGETIAQTVRRLRLQRAADLLANRSADIDRVAREVGFSDAASLTHAFTRHVGVPPGKYRETGTHVSFRAGDRLGTYPVDIREQPRIVLAASRHRGPYGGIGAAFDRVTDRMGPGRQLALFYDDAEAVAPAALRSAAGTPVEGEVPGPLERLVIPAGRFAVLRYTGPYASMPAAYRWLFGPWLLASGEVLRDLPVVEEYLNSPVDTPAGDLATDIWLPLESPDVP